MGHIITLVRISKNFKALSAGIRLSKAFARSMRPNNEYKIIKGSIATLKYFRIFNRWNLVLAVTGNDNGWNDRNKVVRQPLWYLY